jgi:hypothetical protein
MKSAHCTDVNFKGILLIMAFILFHLFFSIIFEEVEAL